MLNWKDYQVRTDRFLHLLFSNYLAYFNSLNLFIFNQFILNWMGQILSCIKQSENNVKGSHSSNYIGQFWKLSYRRTRRRGWESEICDRDRNRDGRLDRLDCAVVGNRRLVLLLNRSASLETGLNQIFRILVRGSCHVHVIGEIWKRNPPDAVVSLEPVLAWRVGSPWRQETGCLGRRRWRQWKWWRHRLERCDAAATWWRQLESWQWTDVAVERHFDLCIIKLFLPV